MDQAILERSARSPEAEGSPRRAGDRDRARLHKRYTIDKLRKPVARTLRGTDPPVPLSPSSSGGTLGGAHIRRRFSLPRPHRGPTPSTRP